MDPTSFINNEVTALKIVLQDVLDSPLLEDLATVWRDIGMSNEVRESRRKAIKDYVSGLLKDMLDEEIELRKKLQESVIHNTAELQKLCQALSIPFELIEDHSLNLREKLIRSRVDELNKLVFDRKKRMKRLVEMETGLCNTLGEKAVLFHTAKDVPSEEDLESFRKRIKHLEDKRNKRLDKLCDLQVKAQRIWSELDMEPSGELKKVHSMTDIKTYIFSEENMVKLAECYRQLEEMVIRLEKKAFTLRESIASLWARLDVPTEDRDLFNQLNTGYKPVTVAKLEAELERLNQLKMENMSKFIQSTREELHKIWDCCFYGVEQRREFAPAFSEDFSDDLLSAHESELDRMQGFYRDNTDVFKLVEKRENMWKKLVELEAKDSDPNRLFNSRGGQLLKDQNMMRHLTKELPKVEKELQTVLTQWEEDYERYFIVNDNRYLDTIESQWAEKNVKKEQEKVVRQKTKETTTVLEMTYGSKPNTPKKKPVKRVAASPLPGRSNSQKVRKVSQSPLITRSATAARPPRAKLVRNAKTPMRPTQRKGGASAMARKILRERNTSTSTTSSMNPEETFLSHANMSLASTGTYTDFQHGIMQGLECQKIARSSFLPKSSSMQNIA